MKKCASLDGITEQYLVSIFKKRMLHIVGYNDTQGTFGYPCFGRRGNLQFGQRNSSPSINGILPSLTQATNLLGERIYSCGLKHQSFARLTGLERPKPRPYFLYDEQARSF